MKLAKPLSYVALASWRTRCDSSVLTGNFPPIPVLDVVLSAPASDHWSGSFTAIVDSGADFTIIPLVLIKSLDAPVIRPAVLSSQWRDRRSVYVYKVDIRVGEIILPAVDVAGDPFSDEIILGRNVLTEYCANILTRISIFAQLQAKKSSDINARSSNRLDLRLEGPALRTHLIY